MKPVQYDNQAIVVIAHILYCPDPAGLRGQVEFIQVEIGVQSSLIKDLEAGKSRPMFLNRE